MKTSLCTLALVILCVAINAKAAATPYCDPTQPLAAVIEATNQLVEQVFNLQDERAKLRATAQAEALNKEKIEWLNIQIGTMQAEVLKCDYIINNKITHNQK